jgi:hypothetical protein
VRDAERRADAVLAIDDESDAFGSTDAVLDRCGDAVISTVDESDAFGSTDAVLDRCDDAVLSTVNESAAVGSIDAPLDTVCDLRCAHPLDCCLDEPHAREPVDESHACERIIQPERDGCGLVRGMREHGQQLYGAPVLRRTSQDRSGYLRLL